MRVVDVMIVGAGRSGTSTLLRFLGAHPGLRAQTTREATWFSDPEGVPDDPAVLVRRYWDVDAQDPVLRLGKSAGLMYEPDSLARLRKGSPEVQLVVLLREPVDRTYSGYWFARARGLEDIESFEDAVWADPSRFDDSPTGRSLHYLDWSIYAKHISALQEDFGRDRVHVFFLDEVVTDPRTAVEPLLAALDLSIDELPASAPRENAAIKARVSNAAAMRKRKRGVRQLLPASLRGALRGAYRRFNETEAELPPIDARVEADLRSWFAEHNDRLADLLGRPLPAGWSTTRA